MIPLDSIKACVNPECRLVLVADPYDPTDAGFYAKGRRPDGSVRYDAQCKGCRCVTEAERYANLTSEQMEERRTRNAQSARRLRRRRGMQPRHRWTMTRVDIMPFRKWLKRAVRLAGSVSMVARAAGVDEAFVRDLLGDKHQRYYGPKERHRGTPYQRHRVTLGVVDHFLVVVDDGTRLEDLYDLIEVARLRTGKGPIRSRVKSERARQAPRVGGQFARAA